MRRGGGGGGGIKACTIVAMHSRIITVSNDEALFKAETRATQSHADQV